MGMTPMTLRPSRAVILSLEVLIHSLISSSNPAVVSQVHSSSTSLNLVNTAAVDNDLSTLVSISLWTVIASSTLLYHVVPPAVFFVIPATPFPCIHHRSCFPYPPKDTLTVLTPTSYIEENLFIHMFRVSELCATANCFGTGIHESDKAAFDVSTTLHSFSTAFDIGDCT